VEFDPATNATTNIVAARNLHIHSLAISRTGVTSTITLPTNGVFNGDIALVVHQGPTSSVTAVRTAGAGTNLVTLNQFDEAVEFVYYNNVWQFNHNRSFIEPIYFSGTNAAANAAASRTNLGLGATNLVQFTQVDAATFFVDEGGNGIEFNGTNVSGMTRTNLGLGATNDVKFTTLEVDELYWDGNLIFDLQEVVFYSAFHFNNTTNAATTRTNLGLPLPALTNTSNVTFQGAIFPETTTNAPTNTNAPTPDAWLDIQVGTNSYKLPLWQ